MIEIDVDSNIKIETLYTCVRLFPFSIETQ